MNDTDFSILQKEIGERVSTERTIRKISQGVLADEIHYSKSQIGKVERGDCMITLEMAVDLVRYFDISLDYLILGKEDNDSEGVIQAASDRLDELYSDLSFYFACHLFNRRRPRRKRK
ncbi:helix-turn-helix domain-containing protein [Anaerolactibacter massiliensis]|uniref:helix-turn-helix domain-containing protein n=1 Tax=Anaerolactibacter massiliensis TaxID=2044573 RepID=UPI000CFA7802|nr:helix-turn-helix transcriptional regulator [Anaerolactibacter massiliensis]